MDGHTTWNASDGSPPCRRGSRSGSMTFSNSNTEPGQPCTSSNGSALPAQATGREWHGRVDRPRPSRPAQTHSAEPHTPASRIRRASTRTTLRGSACWSRRTSHCPGTRRATGYEPTVHAGHRARVAKCEPGTAQRGLPRVPPGLYLGSLEGDGGEVLAVGGPAEVLPNQPRYE